MTIVRAGLPIAASLGLCTVVIALLSGYAARLPRDVPNARSMHADPVPRAGGYAIWAGFIPVAVWHPPAVPGGDLMAWLPPWLVIAAVSAADDARGVAVAPRLGAHCIAALWCAWAIWSGAHPDESIVTVAAVAAVIALALIIAWAANLYNFMDGSDGLAGAMTLVGFGAYGAGATASGAPAIAYFALAAATFPFLVVNAPRATMFLGDVGSVPLGFLAAAFGIAGVFNGTWPAWFPTLVFLPFIADATVTLARRFVHGERVTTAHKDHYYQRLHQMGAGHAGTLKAYLFAMLAAAGTALGCLVYAPAWGVFALGVACVVCFTLFAAIGHRWRRKLSASR